MEGPEETENLEVNCSFRLREVQWVIRKENVEDKSGVVHGTHLHKLTFALGGWGHIVSLYFLSIFY